MDLHDETWLIDSLKNFCEFSDEGVIGNTSAPPIIMERPASLPA
jgi:hypothetical protein